jgi:hypothetical protein
LSDIAANLAASSYLVTSGRAYAANVIERMIDALSQSRCHLPPVAILWGGIDTPDRIGTNWAGIAKGCAPDNGLGSRPLINPQPELSWR